MYASVNWVNVGSDNGLSPGRRQAIIWTNAGILLIEPLGTNFSAILINIHAFSFIEIHLKMLSLKWRPVCPGRDELTSNSLIPGGIIKWSYRTMISPSSSTDPNRKNRWVPGLREKKWLRSYQWVSGRKMQLQCVSIGYVFLALTHRYTVQCNYNSQFSSKSS